MIHFIAARPIVSLLIVAFVSALVALFVGGILRSAGMKMPTQSEIEPEDLMDASEPCSWCQREQAIQAQPHESHGICQRHKEEMLAEARRINHAA